jgi:hypothetical protein
MRELKIVGLDLDGKHVICEGENPADKYRIRVDDRLRAAVRGDGARVNQTHIDIEVNSMLRPKEIQARIRAGASVEQLAESAGVDIAKVERFAHPVLLERSRAAEMATAAHPVLSDGPAVLTLLESVTSSLVARGLNPDNTLWDAWRNEDGRWTVQLGWKAGRSDNLAHFRYCPGSHGGTVTAVDDAARELIDPDFDRPLLRPVAPLAQLDFDEPEVPAPAPVVEAPAVSDGPEPEPKAEQARARRGKPQVPAWEDVLLGVRSSGQR